MICTSNVKNPICTSTKEYFCVLALFAPIFSKIQKDDSCLSARTIQCCSSLSDCGWLSIDTVRSKITIDGPKLLEYQTWSRRRFLEYWLKFWGAPLWSFIFAVLALVHTSVQKNVLTLNERALRYDVALLLVLSGSLENFDAFLFSQRYFVSRRRDGWVLKLLSRWAWVSIPYDWSIENCLTIKRGRDRDWLSIDTVRSKIAWVLKSNATRSLEY